MALMYTLYWVGRSACPEMPDLIYTSPEWDRAYADVEEGDFWNRLVAHYDRLPGVPSGRVNGHDKGYTVDAYTALFYGVEKEWNRE